MRYMRLQPRFVLGSAVVAVLLAGLCASALAQTSKPNYYPATAEGLDMYIKDMLRASDTNDQEHLLAMCNALVLPKAREWFIDTFGKEKGPKLADTYDVEMKNFGPSLANLFLHLNDPKTLKVEVIRIETPEDPQAKLVQTYVLQAMIKPVTLYSVVIKKDGTTSSLGLWSLVYVDNNFRLAGKMMGVRTMAKDEK